MRVCTYIIFYKHYARPVHNLNTVYVSVFKPLNAYDVISRRAIAVMQWPVRVNTLCCSSSLTQNLNTLFQVFKRVK